MLEYKAEAYGIRVEEVDERDTSKTCCICGEEDDSQQVERGLYVCKKCDTVANADVNGAENIRQELEVTPSCSQVWDDRSNGCLAQPSVYLFDTTGEIVPQEQVDCKP